jgi:hypothetical protein
VVGRFPVGIATNESCLSFYIYVFVISARSREYSQDRTMNLTKKVKNEEET